MNHEHSSFAFKLKSVDDAGRFSGLLASFNTVDLGGDKILPGSFTKTIAGNKSFPLLWQHDTAQPIGSFTAKETTAGLMIDGQLLLSIQQAKDCRELLKAGVLKGLSIGYDTVKSDYVGDVRELQELRLWEGSVVTFPMNEAAGISSIKSLSDDDRARHLKSIDVHRRAIAKHQRAVHESLKCMLDIEDDADPEPDQMESDDDGASALMEELRSLVESASQLSE